MLFAMESLASVGETHKTSERIRSACEFLLSKQKEDGGWGETYKVILQNIVPICDTNDELFSHAKRESTAITRSLKSFKRHGPFWLLWPQTIPIKPRLRKV
jgi:hypothetical protein